MKVLIAKPGLDGHDRGAKVVVGGIIPPRDVAELRRLGAARVFPMGTPLPEIVDAFTKQDL